jgi:hypothetical protein
MIGERYNNEKVSVLLWVALMPITPVFPRENSLGTGGECHLNNPE